jgi:hypothetical protein
MSVQLVGVLKGDPLPCGAGECGMTRAAKAQLFEGSVSGGHTGRVMRTCAVGLLVPTVGRHERV